MKWNRKGDRLLSIWWIFSMVIVAASVVIAVLAFYSTDMDVRDFEVKLLQQKLAQCLSPDGKLIDDFFSNDFNINSYCGLDTRAFPNDIPFYARISLMDSNNKEKKRVIYGNAGFEADCLAVKVQAKYYPKCGQKEFQVIFQDGNYKEGKLQIFAASNNLPRRS